MSRSTTASQKTRFSILLAGLAAALVLAGCSSSGGEGEDSESSGGYTVRLGIFPGYTFIDLINYTAIEQGILQRKLDEVDADYELVEVGSGQDLVSGMLGGGIDTGILPTSAIGAVNSQSGKLVVRLATDSFEGVGLVFVGAENYEDERGGDLSAYDGGVWGYSKEGTNSQVLSQFIADQYLSGWDEQTGIAVGPVTAMIPALGQGEVDIVATDAAGAALAVTQGVGYVAYNPAESDEYFPYGRSCNGLGVTAEFAEARPDVVQALVTAQLEALDLLKQQSDADAVLGLLPKEFQEANADGFETAWSLYAPSIEATDGELSNECANASLDYLETLGIANADRAAFEPIG